MNLNEVSVCVVPEGDHKFGLEILQSYVRTHLSHPRPSDIEKEQAGLAAKSFTALWDLSRGEYIHTGRAFNLIDTITAQFNSELDPIKRGGYRQAVQDALAVVDKLLALKVNINVFGENVDATIIIKPILEEVRIRIVHLLGECKLCTKNKSCTWGCVGDGMS